MIEVKGTELITALRSFALEEYFDKVIVDRGIQYYEEGRVRRVEFREDHILASVRGQGSRYTVTLSFYRGEEKGEAFLYPHFTCTCPYGDYCKHMVAVYLEAVNQVQEGEGVASKRRVFLNTSSADREAEPTPSSRNRVVPFQSLIGARVPDRNSSLKKLRELARKLSEGNPARGGKSGKPKATARETPRLKGVVGVLLYPSYFTYEEACAFTIFQVRANAWAPLGELARQAEKEELEATGALSHESFAQNRWDQETVRERARALLREDPSWWDHACLMDARLREGTEWALSKEGVAVIHLLQQYSRVSYRAYLKGPVLQLLASASVPLYYAEKPLGQYESLRKRPRVWEIQVLERPLTAGMRIRRENGTIILQGVLFSEEDSTGPSEDMLVKKALPKIALDPVWYAWEGKAFQVRNQELLPYLNDFTTEFPEAEAEQFHAELLPELLKVVPVRGSLLTLRRVAEPPVPRLYLSEDGDGLRVALRFAYRGVELEAGNLTEATLLNEGGPWQYTQILRDWEAEDRWAQRLKAKDTGLKKGTYPDPPGVYRLKKTMHPVDFLLHALPTLATEGMEVYGEETLMRTRVNRNKPTLSVRVESGIDWFDLEGGVEYGETFCGLKELLRALEKGERYVKLADGTLGTIPDGWIRRFELLGAFGEWKGENLRLHPLHARLVEPLLDGEEEDEEEEQDPRTSLDAFRELKERLAHLGRVEPFPLPQGFIGTLRPYQEHGYRWLHFLRSARIGGILADDMGLGKTVQVLAYLQSLKEREPPGHAHLLVVPKSLVYNWQAEASRFTPALRFLEYLGQGRAEEVSEFDGYDVVITTYATMLRDAEKLRAYPFHHVILDESQAIKNPLAQSTQAARSLQAEHRLVLTGTPMENNIFELWSQFSFLEPALLGPLHRFKRVLGNPVERGDVWALEVVRTLIHPFLLRRTKEQVAPELPPRVEEVLYVDMESAQENLYHAVRERYRQEIQQLLNSDEPWLARAKILEGLLRLRQIAIHPCLYDGRKQYLSAKFLLLDEVISTLREERHRALVFSQFVETLKLLRKELDERQIPYAYLDGKTRTRKEVVEKFQANPDIPLFLISLKAGGTGLNLTAADYVLLLDPWWNPAVEAQASDRTHRIGQDKPVFIYRFITRGTVEEKILLLQEKKREIVKSVIRSDSGLFKTLSREDIEALFSP